MKTIFSDRQFDHAPREEIHYGKRVPHAEEPARARIILDFMAEVCPATDHGLEPILAVHDRDYVEFLRQAYQQWSDAGREGEAGAYTFPIVGRRPLDLVRVDALLGRYSFDVSTPIMAGTWAAAYASAQTALTALESVVTEPSQVAFALCRPPGHHAGRDYLGGYCYLNNAAIAARAAQVRGLGPVAVLDIDYHHGNGTQDIFYEDGEILVVSVHADPKTDYPFYWGHADETGSGAGIGATRNFVLPRGTSLDEYQPVLRRALDHIRDWGARFLVLSFGADIFVGDPISFFELSRDDLGTVARLVSGMGWPTLIVMEGGYATAELGANVATFIDQFDLGR